MRSVGGGLVNRQNVLEHFILNSSGEDKFITRNSLHYNILQYDVKIATVLAGIQFLATPPLTGDASIFGCRQKNILSRKTVTSVGGKKIILGYSTSG
jgi:hypothetical protein